MTTTTTTCIMLAPATGRTTCTHSWALGSAQVAARTAGAAREQAARLWRAGRATEAALADARTNEDAAWQAVRHAEAALRAHRASSGCCL
jgi:hypothetical protein